MQSLKFKTSLKCNGCVNAIKPNMDSIQGIESWKVDLESSDKIVEVIPSATANENLSNSILEGIKQAGYSAEKI